MDQIEATKLALKLAQAFPTSDGIYDWAEHFEKNPRFVLTEENAPIVAWLLLQTGVVPRRVE